MVPPLLIKGGGYDLSKIELLEGGYKIFLPERGDKPEKWGEVDVEMGGCHFFITLQFRSITFTVCVCVCVCGAGGGGGGY